MSTGIDRDSDADAEALFYRLSQNVDVHKALVENLVASVRTAHATSESSWSLTLFANSLRLNVGQVEACGAGADPCTSLAAAFAGRWRIYRRSSH